MKRINIKNIPVLSIVSVMLEPCEETIWTKKAKWIKENYTQKKILEVYLIFIKYRHTLSTENRTLSDIEEEQLLEHMDILWYALTKTQINKLERLVRSENFFYRA